MPLHRDGRRRDVRLLQGLRGWRLARGRRQRRIQAAEHLAARLDRVHLVGLRHVPPGDRVQELVQTEAAGPVHVQAREDGVRARQLEPQLGAGAEGAELLPRDRRRVPVQRRDAHEEASQRVERGGLGPLDAHHGPGDGLLPDDWLLVALLLSLQLLCGRDARGHGSPMRWSSGGSLCSRRFRGSLFATLCSRRFRGSYSQRTKKGLAALPPQRTQKGLPKKLE